MPESGRTIIFNTRWMSHYAGSEDDLPRPYFRYLRENEEEIGGERENFLERNGRCRGYVQVRSDHIELAELDVGAAGADRLGGVTVVFTATPAAGRTRLVGWYEGATLYRERRGGGGSRPPFSAEAPANRCFLIPPAERVFDMLKGTKGHQGQNPICYISRLNAEFDAEICDHLERLKASGLLPVDAVEQGASGGRGGRRPRNADPALRREVEEAAVAAVRDYYEGRGRKVTSVERDNVGWDLETDDGLRIEVKGRRSDDLSVEVTPNEYKAILAAQSKPTSARSYRIAVVTNALEEGGRLHLFAFDRDEWRCLITGKRLNVEPVMGARLTG